MTFHIGWIITPILLLCLFLLGRFIIRFLRSVGFKEWWKQKPYWLKGGLIGLAISILVGIPSFASSLGICRSEQCLWTGSILFAIAYYPVIMLFVAISAKIIYDNALFVIIFAILIYTTIGSLIGWIVGKRKAKKEQV